MSSELSDNGIIACVTGATGLIGRRIVERLRSKDQHVRILTRGDKPEDQNISVYRGGLENENILRSFLHKATHVFHCAAEIHDVSKMWAVNVHGTERLFQLAYEARVKFFCFVSSAGVIGRTSCKFVTEHVTCNPCNTYERSKWATENIVHRGIPQCRIVIIRPTNVVADEAPGALCLPMRSTISDYLNVFLKGGECAHIVHAGDVADAAIHLESHAGLDPSCFFVSCDHEPFNTYAGLWALYKAIERNQPVQKMSSVVHLPIIIPFFLRYIFKGSGNLGNVRYSSEKLLSTGFRFRLGVEGTVRRIVSLQQSYDNENIKR